MTRDHSSGDVREAIGRRLSASIAVERELPEQLKLLLQRLELADDELARKGTRDDRQPSEH